MKEHLKIFSSIGLMVVMGTSAVCSLAQQQSRDRETVERERTARTPDGGSASTGPDRATFERELTMSGPQGPGSGDFLFLATEMSFGGPLVKGAPYSAQAVTESIQTMTDGNRIVNRSTAAVYRDSEGRTRREQTLKSIGPFANAGDPAQTVFINDPEAGTSYSLDTRTLTARKMTAMRFKVSSPELKAGDSKEPVIRYRDGGSELIFERTPAPGAAAEKTPGEPGAVMFKRSMEAGVAMGVASTRNRNARTESLGKQDIAGVEAEGTRTIVTIPAGEIGNERAIEIISERWYSPELQVIVMTRHSDPRFGENSYQLTNINRSEPAHELFEVPPGYTVKEPSSAAMTMRAPISGGVLNGKAITLPSPEYSEIARAAKASGSVTVQVLIDEDGNVISAESVAGHPLLRAAAVNAAREAKFSPTKLSGQAVKVTGVIVYNFVAQ